MERFFIANYLPLQVFRGFEQLSSSIWRRVVAWGKMPLRGAFVGANFGQFFVYEP